jgi:hypothetical protein
MLPVVAIVGAAGLLSDARASTSIAIPFETLCGKSTAAAFVTPVTQTSIWEAGRIVTYTDVHVDQQVAGTGLAPEVWVRTLGGEVGQVGQLVEGEAVLTVGRPSLLFLRPAIALAAGAAAAEPATMPGAYTVTARAQGQFAVVMDERHTLRVRQSSGVGATLPPQGAPPPVLAAAMLHGREVAEATEAVAQGWARTHAP